LAGFGRSRLQARRAPRFHTVRAGGSKVAVALRIDPPAHSLGRRVYAEALSPRNDEGYNSSIFDTPSCHSIGASVKIASGSKRAGCLVFEVKKRAKPAIFQFTMDSGFADETGEWALR
jgi:hypothetical protein